MCAKTGGRKRLLRPGFREITSGCEYGDARELVQIEEIGITRYQAICPASAGSVEKFVVFRVSTDMNKMSRGNDVTIAQKDRYGAFAEFHGNVAIELLARNYAEQFVARCRREN